MNRRKFLGNLLVTACAAPFVVKEAVAGTPAKVEKIVIPFMRADVVNANKRMYPRKVLEVAVKAFEKQPVMGHLGMECSSIIKFDKVSHQVTNLGFRQVEGHEWLCGELKFLTTPNGRLLKEMWDAHPESVAFRTAGVGSGKVNDDGVLVVGDSYKLVAINAISADEAVKWV